MKLILILLSLFFTLQADYITYYINSECNMKRNFAKMEVSSIYNQDIDTTEAECNFSNGNKMKMKLGIGRTFPYGQGGAIPDLWASVWVNEVKVVSRIRVLCLAERLCTFYIKAYNNTVELCDIDTNSEYYKNYDKLIATDPLDKANNFICQKIKMDDINGTKDDIEYPKNGKKLKVGNFKNFYYKNKKFCSNFLKNGKYTLPLGSKILGTGSYAGHWVVLHKMRKADYNNDGIIDDAYAVSLETHPEDRTKYYILPKDNNISKIWPKVDEGTLLQYKHIIFPDDMVENKFFKLLTKIPTNQRNTLDILNFLYPSPFALNGIVYFDMYSKHHNIGSEHIIVKLLPNNRVEHLCYFYEIEENY